MEREICTCLPALALRLLGVVKIASSDLELQADLMRQPKNGDLGVRIISNGRRRRRLRGGCSWRGMLRLQQVQQSARCHGVFERDPASELRAAEHARELVQQAGADHSGHVASQHGAHQEHGGGVVLVAEQRG